jgi:mRNA interferase MazF
VVSRNPDVPDAGDVIWIMIGRTVGHKESGRRPALVLSPSSYNGKVGLALCCPVTSQIKGYPFEVLLPAELPVRGVVLADQLRSLDWRSRRAKIVCRVPSDVLSSVAELIATLLPLPD